MTETSNADHKPHLVRGIGVAGLSVLVLNSMIGAGIFALPAAVSAKAGVLSPWLFLVVGVLIITVVLTFAELASYFKSSGGPVLYTTTAFGPLAGFTTGWVLFVSRVAAFAANSTVMPIYLGEIWPWFGEGIGRALLIVVVCVSLTYANLIGVKNGVRTMAVITLFKLIPIFLLIVLGLQHVSGDVLFPATMPTIDDLGGTTLLLIYAFVGFESVTIVSGESRNPKRAVPRALVMTVIATGILYFLIVLAYVSVLPDAGASGATLTDLGRQLMGPAAGTVIVTLGAFFSIGGNLSSIMLAVPRLPFALAKKRLLPKWFGEIHPKYSTPANSIMFLGALGLALALTGSFEYLAAASSLMRLIGYVLCIASLPAVRNQATVAEKADAFQLKGGYAIPLFALLLCLWIGAQSSLKSWMVTGALVGGGLILYALAARRRSAAATHAGVD